MNMNNTSILQSSFNFPPYQNDISIFKNENNISPVNNKVLINRHNLEYPLESLKPNKISINRIKDSAQSIECLERGRNLRNETFYFGEDSWPAGIGKKRKAGRVDEMALDC